MVWDLVDATFAIFEEVEMPTPYVPTYQSLTSPIMVGISYLVGMGINGVDETKAQVVCVGLTERLGRGEGKVYASLYRNAGAEAQPDMHGVIGRDVVGGSEWVVLVLVDDVKNELEGRGEVEGLVEKWIEGLGKGGEEGVGMDLRFGVWGGELDML